jgi:hypothetical protein
MRLSAYRTWRPSAAGSPNDALVAPVLPCYKVIALDAIDTASAQRRWYTETDMDDDTEEFNDDRFDTMMRELGVTDLEPTPEERAIVKAYNEAYERLPEELRLRLRIAASGMRMGIFNGNPGRFPKTLRHNELALFKRLTRAYVRLLDDEPSPGNTEVPSASQH